MMALVDYGSDSESDSIGAPDDVADAATSATVSKTELNQSSLTGVGDSYFAEDDVFRGTSSLSLPSVVEPSVSAERNKAEGELEDMVKPKDWELKLAEKVRRRKEKKARKREKKEKSKNVVGMETVESVANGQEKSSKGRAKIAAFGALKAVAGQSDSDSDEIKEDKQPKHSNKLKESGLLSILPTPKSGKSTIVLGGANRESRGIMVPPSLRNRNIPSRDKVSTAKQNTSKRSATSDDSDEDELPTDFFGLTSASEPKIPRIGDVPALVDGLADFVGPSRPAKPYVDVDEACEYSGAGSSDDVAIEGFITDEEAHRLIMKYEVGPLGPMEQRSFNSIAGDIVDIRVDDALGPDVRATLLKNLHVAARAKDAMAPLPKSKNPADVTSKRKHQITYLANLAVAREEALQQQWAESKQMRRMGRQKYGF
nr:Mitotic checkpoint protein PRCC domain containing protein [Haemonchus contortus]